MSIARSATESRRSSRALRLAVVLLASMLLHLIAFEWAGGHIGLPAPRVREEPAITAALLPPPPSKPIAAPHPPAPVVHRHKARTRPAPPHPVRPASAPGPALPVSTPATVPAPLASPSGETNAAPADTASGDGAGTAPPAAAAPPAHRFDPPPPAELNYDVYALRDAQQWYGSGKFLWNADGGHYRIDGEASITFFIRFTVLSFHSEGSIDGYGVAPALYSETPFHKPAKSTRFEAGADAHQGTIRFSSSDATFPYHEGTQDRASVLWQLAGIGRGDPGQFAAGASLKVPVAGTHDVETWDMTVVGQEQIKTDLGNMLAWHVVRAPAAGSDEQKIDIWLAPQHDWYPAKVRYTYPNGDYLVLSLTDLAPRRPAAPTANE